MHYSIKEYVFIIPVLLIVVSCTSTYDTHLPPRDPGVYNAIYSGVPWFDNQGEEVNAHGANIIKEGDKYYLFGSKKTDTSNAFIGINAYSSTDLYNWKHEGVALSVQDSGRLGPNRVGERPKVMKSPETGEYVMFMHTDDMEYNDPAVGYATSETITGPYTFQGPLLFNGEPIHRWDMGTFQDTDGTGYLLIHGGYIYKLSDDYKSITDQVLKDMCEGCESPALFKKDGVYFFMGSDLTGWERNDNNYYTATSLSGPWEYGGHFAPEGTLTWNSQTSFVFPIEGSKDTTYMFMGDRWSYPRQSSAATYVWQPLTVSGNELSIPEYQEAWQINTETGVASSFAIEGEVIDNTSDSINFQGQWQHLAATNSVSANSRSDSTGASFTYSFNGRQVAMYSIASPDGGYARIKLTNSKGEPVLSTYLDMYSKYVVSTPKFISPLMEKDDYKLEVTVVGQHWSWTVKSGKVYSSSGDFISINKIVVNN